MDPIDAIRRAAADQGLRPWTLSRQGRLAVRVWQRLLDPATDVDGITWGTVRAAAEQLGVVIEAVYGGD